MNTVQSFFTFNDERFTLFIHFTVTGYFCFLNFPEVDPVPFRHAAVGAEAAVATIVAALEAEAVRPPIATARLVAATRATETNFVKAEDSIM